MPCEHYKDALVESAATGAEPQGELRAHLAACDACRAAFAQEQSLFSSIDTGLHATANAEVPASLLPRVRAGLDQAVAPPRRWFFVGSTLAASFVLAMAFLLIRSSRHTVGPQYTASSQVPGNPSPSELAPPARENAVRPSITKAIVVNRQRLAATRPATTIDEPQVLVAAGQESAVAQLIRDLRLRASMGEALVADARDRQFQDLQIPPLAVNPLEVKPLSDVLQEPR